MFRESTIKRFWDKVNKTNNCWNWTACKDKDGYGVFNINPNRKYEKAHRFIYELQFGEIPKDKIVCHHCDNPSCVNPQHIYLGTYTSNARDREKRNRGRDQNGTKNHMAVLNWGKVKRIRGMWQSGEFTQKDIADHFNVSRGCITGIIYNVNWRE